MKILYLQIDELLRQNNKTRYWLANEINMGYPNLMKLCNNETDSIHFDILENICKALNCTPNDILKIE